MGGEKVDVVDDALADEDKLEDEVEVDEVLLDCSLEDSLEDADWPAISTEVPAAVSVVEIGGDVRVVVVVVVEEP